ncbi:hypothetical protein GCM10010446_31800 [Streptomyces enissocaesilis]|uniref:Uncharacterized protein n=1 Tax=Streptomyces enissocaesilis TaxID=332589 RepID=A0ABP6JU57_9ACTN
MARQGGHRVQVGGHSPDSGLVGQYGQQVAQRARTESGLGPGPQRPRQSFGYGHFGARRGREVQRDGAFPGGVREEDTALAAAEAHGTGQSPLGAQHVCGGQCGMPAQVGLGERGEPADRPVGLGPVGQREGEVGLRVVQFGRDLPHPRVPGPLPGGQERHTPAGFPANGRSVKASTTHMRMPEP